MSSNFPKLPAIPGENHVIGSDFEVMKKTMKKYGGNVYNFTHDRLIPSRKVNKEFLISSQEKDCDITSSDNNLKTMKKVQYQNTLKSIFYNEQDKKFDKLRVQEFIRWKIIQRNSTLIHFDWQCKLDNVRENFLPDFETMEKKSFYPIYNYVWSSRNLIAATSNIKLCLYHPMKGFTRAIEIHDTVALAFSNSGDYLVYAYRKSRFGPSMDDVNFLQLHDDVLFNSETLNSARYQTVIKSDITALCFTRNDDFLICGTNHGKIYIFESEPKLSRVGSEKMTHSWTLLKSLSETHKHKVIKICYSAGARFMASLDEQGEFKIWNGGSWTYMFSYQHEKSRLYKHFEWHPYVENELVIGRESAPGLFLFNVTERKIVASYIKQEGNWQLSSIAFNPVTAQLAVCFYDEEEFVNRVCLLASMSQVINSFDFDYIKGGLKLFWNSDGLMLGAGSRNFRFAFWSYYQTRDFELKMVSPMTSNRKSSKKLLTLGDSKKMHIR